MSVLEQSVILADLWDGNYLKEQSLGMFLKGLQKRPAGISDGILKS